MRESARVAVAIVGVALEVGIESTARHAADLGSRPIVVVDACGGRDQAARERSIEGLSCAVSDRAFIYLVRRRRLMMFNG